MSAEKKTEKDINTCFYRLNYLACKPGDLTTLHHLLIFFAILSKQLFKSKIKQDSGITGTLLHQRFN